MYFVAVIANMVVFISPSLSFSEALRHIVFFLLDFEGNTRTEPTHSLKNVLPTWHGFTRFERYLTTFTCPWVGILSNYFVPGVWNLLFIKKMSK